MILSSFGGPPSPHRQRLGRSLLMALLAAAWATTWTAGTGAQAPAAARPAGGALPRTSDGKPNLNGIWQVMNTAHVNLEAHSAAPGMPGGLGVVDGDDIPYRPDAKAKRVENAAKRAQLDPVGKCFIPGVPRATYMPFPFQIAQTAQHVAIAYEFAHTQRIIYTDGTPHPGDLDFWMGDSRGKWEGDTLVVDNTHFNDRTWFDMAGNYHSDALHVVERYTLADGGRRIDYAATIEDPQVFTRPWTIRMPIYKRVEPNLQLVDYDCVDFFWLDYFRQKK
jgi:hypothetical protein